MGDTNDRQTQVYTFGKSWYDGSGTVGGDANAKSTFCIRSDPVVTVACGDEHSAIITESGRIFTFGANAWGQLGVGSNKRVTTPTIVTSLKSNPCLHVACGRSHTLVSTRVGQIYAFGKNEEGQLGIGNTESAIRPMCIMSLTPDTVKHLSCGSDHSAVIMGDGKLFLWGSNASGQLGLGKDAQSLTPKELKIKGVTKFKQVACGYYHTAVITDTGDLYTFGEGEGGKLGLGPKHTGDVRTPTKVTGFDSPVTHVACGSNHTIAVTAKETVYAFGDGGMGQLGFQPGDESEVTTPKPIQCEFFPDTLGITTVSCGENHSAVILSSGKLLTFGSSRHGMLGHKKAIDDVFVPTPVEFAEPVRPIQVACGGSHTLVLTAVIDEGSEYSEYSETASEDEGGAPVNSPPAATKPAPSTPLSSSQTASDGNDASVGIGSVARANRRSVHVSGPPPSQPNLNSTVTLSQPTQPLPPAANLDTKKKKSEDEISGSGPGSDSGSSSEDEEESSGSYVSDGEDGSGSSSSASEDEDDKKADAAAAAKPPPAARAGPQITPAVLQDKPYTHAAANMPVEPSSAQPQPQPSAPAAAPSAPAPAVVDGKHGCMPPKKAASEIEPAPGAATQSAASSTSPEAPPAAPKKPQAQQTKKSKACIIL